MHYVYRSCKFPSSAYNMNHLFEIAKYLQLQTSISGAHQAVQVMTFLCFLGALPASLVVLSMDAMVSFKVYRIALNMMKTKYARTSRDHVLLWYTIYLRDKPLIWRWLSSHRVDTHNPGAHHNSNRKQLKNYYRSTRCHTVNFMQL